MSQAGPTDARIDRAFFTNVGGTGQHFLAGATTSKDQAAMLQTFQSRLIAVSPTALIKHRPIPLQSTILESPQNLVCGSRHHPRYIKVFDAQQPRPANMAGQTVTAERGDQ